MMGGELGEDGSVPNQINCTLDLKAREEQTGPEFISNLLLDLEWEWGSNKDKKGKSVKVITWLPFYGNMKPGQK